MLRLKELGNACVKEQKYEEAMFHYTHAIKLDAENYSLYSNRSLVFTKMEQYNFAMEDAMMTIKLKPDWTKVRTHNQFKSIQDFNPYRPGS